MKKITFVGAAFALLAACGGESEPTVAETATTGAPATAAATAEAVVSTAPGAMPTELTEDLVYHAGGEPFSATAGAVDVIAPTTGGPWPTVIVFHGDPRTAGKGWHRPDAKMIAEQGRVVFLPAWGHVDSAATQDMDVGVSWDLMVRELKCAVAFAHRRTAEFGGNPDHITLYGLSAGGNAALMAGLADAEPLDTCATPGPATAVQALVPIDADPESFYIKTPWRYLDGAQDIPIHITVVEDPTGYFLSVEPDPATSWLSQRHTDIDLVADLEQRGYLADGKLYLKESSEYAYEILTELGYDTTYVVMTGSHHDSWSDEGRAIVIETVLNAES